MWEMEIEPRFSDLDPLGHINNVVYPVWFDQARTPFIYLFNPDLDFRNWKSVMASIHVQYVREAYFGSKVRILTWVKKIGTASVTSYQEAWQDGELKAKADAVAVYLDLNTQKSGRIPDSIREELGKHMVDKNNPNLRTRSGRFPAL